MLSIFGVISGYFIDFSLIYKMTFKGYQEHGEKETIQHMLLYLYYIITIKPCHDRMKSIAGAVNFTRSLF